MNESGVLKEESDIDRFAESIRTYWLEKREGYSILDENTIAREIGSGAKVIFHHSPERPLFCGFEGPVVFKKRFIQILKGPHFRRFFWEIRTDVNGPNCRVGRENKVNLSDASVGFSACFVFLRNCYDELEAESGKI